MEWVRTDDDGTSHHVNHVESFWRMFKASVRGTHISVSPKYLDCYLKEFTFRANHREMKNAMFDLLVAAVWASFNASSNFLRAADPMPRFSS